MKIIILTSRLGYGHTRAGEAIAAAFAARRPGAEVEMIDFWSLMAPKVSAALKEAYLELVGGSPEAYERLYQVTEAEWQEHFRAGRLPPPLDALAARVVEKRFPEAGGRLPLVSGASLDETLFVALLRRFSSPREGVPARLLGWGLALGMRSLLMARLLNRIQSAAPAAVIATQMMPATLLSYIRDNGELVDLPSYGVLTDYGVHDFWARSGLDCLCVAHRDLAEELAAKGTASRVEVTGMPLMPAFGEPPERSAARAALGIAADRPTILATGGAYAIGVRQTLGELLDADARWQILATGAAGQPASPELVELAAANPGRLMIFDRRPDMARLLRAADLVVGKPGGLTLSEAMACGRPLVAVRMITGQESYNVAFLERHGCGVAVGADGLVAAVGRVLGDADRLARMSAAARRAGRRDGARRIAALIEESSGAGRSAARWAAT